MKKIITTLISLLLICHLSLSEEWKNPKTQPPLAKPKRVTAGESLPPLPLPATPLRRSEPKRQPAKPALVGLLNFSDLNNKYPTTQVDIEKLIQFANNKLNIQYRFIELSISRFTYNPSELPIIYITGWTPMPELSENTIQKLRQYVYSGGTIIFHSQCSRSEFTTSARKQIERIFPNRKLAPVENDNPIFHSYFQISQVKVRRNDEPIKTLPPYLECVYLGVRPAIIFSPIDLNCSWNIKDNPIQGGTLYSSDDGLCLGINIITYTLATHEYARNFSYQDIYHQQNDNSRDELVLAQIIHNGEWDCTPHSLPSLLKYIQNNTTLKVQFKRENVLLSNTNINSFPILYITGLRDFTLSKNEINNLKSYLNNGGFLFADSSIGNKSFDVAFRREMNKITNKSFEKIETNSIIYSMPYNIKEVSYTNITNNVYVNLNNQPCLEGIKINDQYSIIYSKLGLSNGWSNLKYEYNIGYCHNDSLKLGINIISYALTH